MDKLLLLAKTVGEIKNQVKSLQNTPPEIHNFLGEKGDKGTDGKNGIDGKNGKDGLNGKDGKDGVDGEQGISVVNANIELDGSLVLELSNGTEIDVGEVVGRDGRDGINGLQGANGIGVPIGGTIGQVLSKIDSTDYNTQWITVSGGGGTETDPVFVASPAYGITATNITNWNTAYGWGNHASAGYLTSGTIGVSVQGYSTVLNNTTASFTTADETKLDGIAAGAEVNVNADWNAISGDALILNKPTLGTAAATNSTAYATAAQGTKADSALQPAAIGVTVQAYDADLTSWAAIAPSTKQDTLVSNTNIKTVNSTSLLGSGDISVGVTSVTGTAPISSSGGATPAISMAAATTSVNGYLTSTDWTTFNDKQTTLVSGTNIKTINGNSVLGSGDLTVSGSFTGGTLTSQLKLATGTASTGAAPIEFVSGTLNTTAEAGAMEYDGTAFYSSMANSTRGVMPSEQLVVLTGTNTLTSQTAAQAIFDGGGGTTNGAVTLPIGTYAYETSFCITGMSATSGSFGFTLGGTATKTFSYNANASKAGTSLTTPMALVSTCGSAAITTLVANSTGTVGNALIKGIIRVTVAGTIIPQISLTVAAAAVIQANGYFKVSPIGNATVATVGNWS